MAGLGSSKVSTFLILAIIALVVVFGAIGMFVLSSGQPSKPTQMNVRTEVLSNACRGNARVFVQLADDDGKMIPDVFVQIYGDSKLLDSLYTDRNGRIWLDIPLEESWCGRKVKFSALYDGDNARLSSSGSDSAYIRAPSNLSLYLPNQSLQGDTIQIIAKLTNRLQGSPLSGKIVMIDSVNAVTDANGTAFFNITLDDVGNEEFSVFFGGDSEFEPAQSQSKKVSVLKPLCEDGTVIGECSGSLFCSTNRTLEFSCNKCGCPSGLLCIENECISEEQKIERLIEELQKSSVLIRSNAGIGSGVIISENDSEIAVLTNRHVVDPEFELKAATNLEVQNFDGEIAKPVRIIVAPNQLDMAIVFVKKKIGTPVAIGYELEPKRGATVLVLGSPLGIQNSVSKGIISNFFLTNTSSGFDYEAIQTDAAVNPGSSGGGVFLASSGQLIGITTFKVIIKQGQLAEGLGFALPVKLLDEFQPDEWVEIQAS